jgi:hypothetical protein
MGTARVKTGNHILVSMPNELLYAKIEALEGKRPLAHRRSRR